MSLDLRMIDLEGYSDHIDNKASHCAKLLNDYYRKYDAQKGTQFVFSDLGTYKPGEWNVYSEIKRKLVEDYHIPSYEARFIQECKNEKAKKAMAECGIGTPATRANIIETLLLRDYIQREKKAIVPTEKGLAVYEIVKEKRIANAEMTGAWELSLAAIEAGTVGSQAFAEGIRTYTEQICQELLSLVPVIDSSRYPTYRCPKCGNDSVGIYAKVAKCRSEGCDFHIFRSVCGTFLSEENLRDLITQGQTSMLKNLTSKAGKKFNARLVLREDHTTAFDFGESEKRKPGKKQHL